MEIAKKAVWNGKEGFVYAYARHKGSMMPVEPAAWFVANGFPYDANGFPYEREDLVRIRIVNGEPKVVHLASVFPNNPHAYTDLQCLALAYQAAIDVAESIRGEK